jgi:hypothetical protein
VLQAAQGELVAVPADEVERLVPVPKLLMPGLPLHDTTAEQVADLIAYLSSLR